MRAMYPRIASCWLAGWLVACGGGSSAPDPDAPTFTNVWTEVILANHCQSSECHGSGAGGLVMTSQTTAYSNLVGIQAAGMCPEGGDDLSCSCGASGETRVVADHPEQSLIVEKISGDPSCGTHMPPTGAPVTAEQITLVTNWISAGAKND